MALDHAAALRPWYRLHRSTWVVVALVSCGVLFVEIPAEVTVHYLHFAERWTEKHGWPWVYLERSTGLDPSDALNSIRPDAIPWLHAACWNVSVGADEAGNTRYRPRYIAPDALAGVLVICAACSFAEWRRRRRWRVWQLSLGELLTGVLLCAAASGWWRHQHDRRKELLDLAQVPTPIRGTLVNMREPTSGASLEFGYAGPGWLARLVGTGPLEVFNEPVSATLVEDHPAHAIRKLLRHKRLLTHLREIGFWHFLLGNRARLAEIDEESIRNLAQLRSVQSIWISGCRLDDRALNQLAEIPNLRELSLLSCDGMTDAGIARLRGSPHIEELFLEKTPLRSTASPKSGRRNF